MIIRTVAEAIENIERERDELLYWLLRAYLAIHREGWEEGLSEAETFDRILDVLSNYGADPTIHRDRVKRMLENPPRKG